MSSGTPLQVLRLAEEAEKLYQEQIDVIMGTGGTGETGEPEAQAPSGASGPADDVVIDTEETLEQKLEKANHRNEVLQGKYNAEVPRLALQLKELQDQIAALTVVKKPQDEKPVEKKKLLDSMLDDPNVKYLKDEYPEVFNGISVALDKAVEAATEKVDKLTKEVADQKKHTEKSDRDKFYDELDKVDGWDTINKSPEFNEWLDETEPLTGFKRRDILTDAYSTMNATRAKNFFQEFSKKSASAAPVIPAVVKKEEAGIAPKTVGSKKIVDPGDKTKNYIRASDIKRAYDDKLKGKYIGKDAEWAAIEVEINKATVEQRVIVNQ